VFVRVHGAWGQWTYLDEEPATYASMFRKVLDKSKLMEEVNNEAVEGMCWRMDPGWGYAVVKV